MAPVTVWKINRTAVLTASRHQQLHSCNHRKLLQRVSITKAAIYQLDLQKANCSLQQTCTTILILKQNETILPPRLVPNNPSVHTLLCSVYIGSKAAADKMTRAIFRNALYFQRNNTDCAYFFLLIIFYFVPVLHCHRHFLALSSITFWFNCPLGWCI